MLMRPSGRKDEQGRAIGYWPTLFNYVFDNRDRDYQRQQLQVDAQRWRERSKLGRWFGLAGWRDLRVFGKLRPRPDSVEGRYLRRSRRVAWAQILLLVGVLGVLAESAWWADQNKLPFGYVLVKPLWALGLYQPVPEMVEIIAPGQRVTFTMGCVDGRDDEEGANKCDENLGSQINELPVHEVTLIQPFCLGKYEITFMQYDYYVWDQERMGKSVVYPSDQGWGRYNQPVINVSWENAVAYTDWLKRKTGMAYRLPTESEWEYAARAGQNTGYSWGNSLEGGNANCHESACQDGFPRTAPVGSFTANAFGLYDMAGNVEEWCQNEYSKYSREKVIESQKSTIETASLKGQRVLRGGSWLDGAWGIRSATRGHDLPGEWSDETGFRLALDQ